MNILKVKSMHPMTEYAPTWDFCIGNSYWEYDKMDIIENWFIANEQKIIDLYPPADLFVTSGQGVGRDSVTSRYNRYNLFNFANELPELNDLLKFLRLSYLKYLKETFGQIRDVNIVCWFNVLHKDATIADHVHKSDPFAYLGGNLFLNNYNTKTYYKCPLDREVIIPIDNKKGCVSWFPSYIPHFSSTHEEDKPRVSIGFDLHLDEDPRCPHAKDSPNFIQFMNENIFQEIISDIPND